MAHLHLLVIQTHCRLWERSWVGISIAIHVRTAGGAVQLLPAAAVTLPVSMSGGNPGKNLFYILSPTAGQIGHSLKNGSNKHHTF